MRAKRGMVLGGLVVGAASVALLINCVSDPREATPVAVVSTCDLTQLNADPSSPEATVKAYVTAAEALAAKTTDVAKQLTDVCNQIGADLGTPAGTDPLSACGPISARASKAQKNEPPAPPGPPPPAWFQVTAPPSCKVDPTARATCLSTCANKCDTASCTPASKLSGSCDGTCTGTCSVSNPATCTGSCQGTCAGEMANLCAGECLGACKGPSYSGNCGGACAAGFIGFCGGTCTGTCDGVTINGGLPDGGGPPPSDGGEAGPGMDAGDDGGDGAPSDAAADGDDGGAATDGGPAEGGPPDAAREGGGPPANADGNCQGLCAGWCSSKASGNCAAPCMGPFAGGVCTFACTGTCVSGPGSGCVTGCTGLCTSPTGDGGAPCPGICTGGCSTPLKNPICAGSLSCGQNVECGNACEATAALAFTCTPPMDVEVEAISDPKLYAALKKHGGALATVVQALSAVRNAKAFIANRAESDFEAIGAKGERVRACVLRGQTAIATADVTLTAAVTADPTVRKSQ